MILHARYRALNQRSDRVPRKRPEMMTPSDVRPFCVVRKARGAEGTEQE